jgi:hypothetical protein
MNANLSFAGIGDFLQRQLPGRRRLPSLHGPLRQFRIARMAAALGLRARFHPIPQCGALGGANNEGGANNQYE